MRQSQLFTKTRREAPSDETSKNAQLLIRAGFINKEMAGVYSLLPLGFKVVNNIKKIVSEEMERIGSEEIIMSTLQNKETWKKTDRWSDEKVDVWFKSELKNGNDVGFGWSHEEPITEMMKSFIASYNDLPRYVHQFQNKLRNEVRAKSGIIRCREFLMKDMYAFCATDEDNMDFYKKSTNAYMNVFKRIGLGDITFITSASGGFFTDKFSHEFQTICETGEDIIYINKEKKVAVNKEIYNKETVEKMGMVLEDFGEKKAAEVGNIFNFGTGKCEQMGLYFSDKDGVKKPVHLSSYGIGITRLLGVLVEVFADDKGIVWPEFVAPFKLHLIEILSGKPEVKEKAEKIYKKMGEANVLYDDRDARAGEKFADADLIGIPYQVIVSEKNLLEGKLELKNRKTGEIKMIKEDELQDLC
ncbi:MAG: prolyl-tRNA synthetase [Candidatus Zambryskibacteria bacterium RIFCSPLOWO2_01_FULL_39_39]|uniref:Proline--tRNA ligase n=1 Tax=Candidatus Zambryskibacteria bacterium RIFCSPLOWO2_01_FULL_39_39 TaxID=1802758 RepID=A0A1G2TW69_9BACT|nr:MAG: prolyl-tRNA synthetase [Candidatus Zambryskibacteria bacterium RIFCSPHIGHO2_01_FULL_39_63]OHA94253.1 MAG: prolyl-tRNA synthetase [Candidatus Zambryskibacteria bacterium RIFCSPHIGHO2_02_FULL_39_19]OHA98480.1 MAG: prolyl-tRNA synthetase [Candidatus Zambryskibacteria bacterium RIFCSPHIGHO2_12_FULL_39_21]OHB01399.1 MAG: prolyl-tRNA synthetase [Candidatus Zambryskibacteria bacterium RIFCSPLOWO2_01_FULL_39_39]